MSHVDLGYLGKCEPWQLKSHFFPSKVGGRPAWLGLKQLPTPEQLQCTVCSKPMIFLCQVYAPIEENQDCFHRTLFLFICRNSNCSIANESKNIALWRCQIPRHNEFYSSEPPEETQTNVFDLGKSVKLCTICGCSASKHCSKCKVEIYCSREHQLVDWKCGHKDSCGVNHPNEELSYSTVSFEEFELLIEPEEEEPKNDSDEETEEKRLKDYQKLVEEGKVGTLSDVPEDDLQQYASVDEDETFAEFRKRTGKHPEQILRYDRGGEPLWIASDPRPVDIPPCEWCNSPRQFEFQIVPQLLYTLHENNIDFGTVVVYTCKESCSNGPAYKKEFVFKQDVKAS